MTALRTFQTRRKVLSMPHSIPTITLNGITPSPEFLKLHASLTTPESEDWIVVPNKNQIFSMAMREKRSLSGRLVTLWKSGWWNRLGMLRFLGNLPERHELGVLSVYVATDAETVGTHSLLSELASLGKRKSFNILSMVLPGVDTTQCIRCLDPASSNSGDFERGAFMITTVN
jgi:hypothetical protein